jgi:hypothetical protein
MICAGIKSGLVKAILKIDSEEEFHSYGDRFEILIDVTSYTHQPQIDWAFDGLNFNYGQLSAVPSVKLTKIAFRRRFTLQEKGTIISFGLNNISNANPTIASYAAMVMATLDDQRDAKAIDIAGTDAISGIGNLVSIGLLSSERASQILNTPPTYDELYRE